MNMVKFFYAFLTLLTVQLIVPSRSAAYYIDTGLSDPCHEKLTAEMLLDFLAQFPDVGSDIPLPETDLWEMYADAIFENFDFIVTNPSQKYFIASLMIGTRWPDEHGRSVTSLASLYDTHGDPSDQHEHFLRRLEHDFESGNLEAIDYSKSFIASLFQRSLVLLALPPRQQIVSVTEYVEFYGQIRLNLWGPAYYIGLAMHTLQDSFSHTVRSDDLHQIVHVMNFLDAITDGYDAHRDGLAHSYGMDECAPRNEPIYRAARLASADLLEVFVSGDPQVFIELEENWLRYSAGCNMDNRFCNSLWYANVTREPTEPIVGCSYGDVKSVPGNLFGLASTLWGEDFWGGW